MHVVLQSALNNVNAGIIGLQYLAIDIARPPQRGLCSGTLYNGPRTTDLKLSMNGMA